MKNQSIRPHKPSGRPLWQPTEEDLSRIEELSQGGATLSDIASLMDVDYRTVKAASDRDPRIKVLIEKGKAKGKQEIMSAFFDLVRARSERSVIFGLKTFWGLNDNANAQVSISGNNGVNIMLDFTGEGKPTKVIEHDEG